MSCPHGHGSASTCSQCCNAVPRIVSQVDGEITIDGKVVRAIEPTQSTRTTAAQRRATRKARR